MHQQSHGTSVRLLATSAIRSTAKLVARKRWIMIVLVLALLSMSQSLPVNAAPASAGSVRIFMSATKIGVKRTICVGDKVPIRVMIKSEVDPNVEKAFVTVYGGLKVTASVNGGNSVGTISPEKSTTSLKSDPVGAAMFTFTAGKAGTATINFSGKLNELSVFSLKVSSNTVRAYINLKVEDCKYRFSSTSVWSVPGEAHITLIARIDVAGMKDNGDGTFEGKAQVNWSAYASQVGDCSGMLVPDSQATVFGLMSKASNQITWDVSFTPATAKLKIDCQETSATRDIPLKPDPVTFTASVNGGGKNKPQMLRGPEDMPGIATVKVTRITWR